MMLLKADDGVSESLGFVLIALILTLVMAMILMVGYPIFQESVNEGHMQNMEEGFFLLSANANKVALYESPVQSSELKLYGGTLALREDGYVKISYEYDPGTGYIWKTDTVPVTPQIIEYSLNNEKVAYVLGGVFKKEGDNIEIITDPIIYQYPLTGTTKTMVIPLIESLNPETALAGADLTRIEVSSPYYSRATGTLDYLGAAREEKVRTIKLEIKSEYKEGLSRYFSEKLGFTRDADAADGALVMHRDFTSDINLYLPYCQLYTTLN